MICAGYACVCVCGEARVQSAQQQRTTMLFTSASVSDDEPPLVSAILSSSTETEPPLSASSAAKASLYDMLGSRPDFFEKAKDEKKDFMAQLLSERERADDGVQPRGPAWTRLQPDEIA